MYAYTTHMQGGEKEISQKEKNSDPDPDKKQEQKSKSNSGNPGRRTESKILNRP